MRTTLDGTLDSRLTRLPAHLFDDSLPIHAGVFLVNSVFTLDNLRCSYLHPYIGGGIGGAVLSVSGADSFQQTPPEPDVNHFNSETDASADAFAAQVKAGIDVTLTNHFSLFAEYRYLFIGPTRFNFGSTVYPGHVATSPWSVNVDSMHYNLGTVGIKFNV